MLPAVCSAGGTLTLPASLTVIGEQAFFGDTNIEDVILPETAARIEKEAFANSSIRTIYIPGMIEYIAKDAFTNCDSMTAIVRKGTYFHRYCMENGIDYVFQNDTGDQTAYYGKSSYQLFNEPVEWETAKAACERLGGHLVTIGSAGEQAVIENLLRDCGTPDSAYWIGLTDSDGEGQWDTWITGETVMYSNWAAGEPNNDFAGGQDYGAVMTGDNNYAGTSTFGSWDDISNGQTDIIGGYICEWRSYPKYRALLIGEQRHLAYDEAGDSYYIDDCSRNAAGAARLQEMLGRVYGPDGSGRFSVVKRTDLDYDAVRTQIMETFADTTDDDISLFFIATHGDSDNDGELLMPFSGDPDSEEDIISYLDSNWYRPFSTLASWLKQYVKGRVIVLIESCGSGAAIWSSPEQNGAGISANRRSRAADRSEAIANAAVNAFKAADPGIAVRDSVDGGAVSNSTGDLRIPKFYVLTAAAYHEMSWGYEYHNVSTSFTYFVSWLTEGIGTAGNSPADVSPRDTCLTLTELYDYMKQYDDYAIMTYEIIDGERVQLFYNQHVQRYPAGSQFRMFVVR